MVLWQHTKLQPWPDYVLIQVNTLLTRDVVLDYILIHVNIVATYKITTLARLYTHTCQYVATSRRCASGNEPSSRVGTRHLGSRLSLCSPVYISIALTLPRGPHKRPRCAPEFHDELERGVESYLMTCLYLASHARRSFFPSAEGTFT